MTLSGSEGLLWTPGKELQACFTTLGCPRESTKPCKIFLHCKGQDWEPNLLSVSFPFFCFLHKKSTEFLSHKFALPSVFRLTHTNFISHSIPCPSSFWYLCWLVICTLVELWTSFVFLRSIRNLCWDHMKHRRYFVLFPLYINKRVKSCGPSSVFMWKVEGFLERSTDFWLLCKKIFMFAYCFIHLGEFQLFRMLLWREMWFWWNRIEYSSWQGPTTIT